MQLPLGINTTVTIAQITSGDDAGMSPATLHWGDYVIYQLGLGADLLFNFRSSNPITLTVNGQNMLDTVVVNAHDKWLKVTLKDNSGTWANGKVTLFFEPVLANQKQQPAAGGLDPRIINVGKIS